MFQPESPAPCPPAHAPKRRLLPWLKRVWLQRVALMLLSTWLVLSCWQAPVVKLGQVGKAELRGIWMTNVGAKLMYYTTQLDEAVANLAQHRLNTLYPAVWNRGETLHPSAIAQQAGSLAFLPTLPGQDVLAGLVKQAHRQHLRLIPWFEYGLMIPMQSTIAQTHPDWLTMTQTGETTAEFVESGPAPTSAAQPAKRASIRQGWLNPAHPEVQQFLTDLIVDVVRRYPVEGIQLDDHFGWPIALGYDPYTVKLYRADHHGQAPPRDPNNPEWMAWRAARLTQLMRQIATAVHAVRPQVVVSLSPNAADYAYRTTLQDWGLWVEQGLLDEVVVQVYRRDLAALRAELVNDRLHRRSAKVPISIGLYTGPFLGAKPIQRLQQEVETVRRADYAGVSFFSWETTLWLFKGGSTDQVKRSFFNLFPQASLPS
jgi:uncharacterized lipoprotein YddW (UPF0748 family)